MNIDFHVHGILSKKCKFSKELLLQSVDVAKENGLNGFVLCEHFNAKCILEAYKYLERNFEYVGDKYLINDFSIFLGMEVNVKGGGHVIVCGNRNNILEIRKVLDKYEKKPNYIPLERLIKLGENYNCLMIGCHPLRKSQSLIQHKDEILSRLHAIDLNGKDIFQKGELKAKSEITDLSNKLNIPYITGSDSHYPIQLGCVKTCFKKEFTTINDLIEGIKSRDFTTEISNCLSLKVFTAKVVKDHLKEKMW